MQTILEILNPIIAILVPILITAAIGLIVKAFQKFGFDIEAKHREALQSALENAAAAALAKVASRSEITSQGFLAAPLMSIALSYLMKSIPDALAHFGLDKNEAKLIDLLRPHIAKAVQKKFSLTPAE